MTTSTHEQIKLMLQESACEGCEGIHRNFVCVHIEAIAELPSRFGDFHIIAFSNNRDDKEHVAIVNALKKGDAEKAMQVSIEHVMESGKWLEEYLDIPAELLREKEEQASSLMKK